MDRLSEYEHKRSHRGVATENVFKEKTTNKTPYAWLCPDVVREGLRLCSLQGLLYWSWAGTGFENDVGVLTVTWH